jgi:hypothetical protein
MENRQHNINSGAAPINMGGAGNIGLITQYSDIPQVVDFFRGYRIFIPAGRWDHLRMFGGGVLWHSELPISVPRAMKTGEMLDWERWIGMSASPVPNFGFLYPVYRTQVKKGEGVIFYIWDPISEVKVRIFLKKDNAEDRRVMANLQAPEVGEAVYYIRAVFSDGFVLARSPISSLVYIPRGKNTFVVGARFGFGKKLRAIVK